MAKIINKLLLVWLKVTLLSNKRIRSSYHRRILSWLIDSGGSVSQISKSLKIRTPHTSLALSQLREKGLVSRNESSGIRGAIHKITKQGRIRLDEDYIALYKLHASNSPQNQDAVVLESKGPIIILCYVKNPPKSLIILPENPYLDLDSMGKDSSGSMGVRWASVKSSSINWYSKITLEKVQPPNKSNLGTIEGWFEQSNSFAIVRANLLNSDEQWNVNAGTWFDAPAMSEENLPEILSSGGNKIGDIVDSDISVSWKNRLHAHLTSKVDSSMLINSFSNGCVVLRNNLIKPQKTILPIGCLSNWLKMKHPRMSSVKLDTKYKTLSKGLISNSNNSLSLALLRDISRDFGECEWVGRTPGNIEISGLSLIGMKSLIECIKAEGDVEFIIEWNWSILENLDFLEYVLRDNNCRLLVTKYGDVTEINSALAKLVSLRELATVKLHLSREHSLTIKLSTGPDVSSPITHNSVPRNAEELVRSYSGKSWDLDCLTNREANFEYRKEIWQAMNFYPEGNEEWANKIEIHNPLAAWIATPNGSRKSRWIRIVGNLPDKWADLLEINIENIEVIISSFSKGSGNWQKKSIIYISEQFVKNNQLLIQMSHYLDSKSAVNLSACILLASKELPDDFTELIQRSIDNWLDGPLFAQEILATLFPNNSVKHNDRYGVLDKVRNASMIHPKDSILYNWSSYVTSLMNSEVISSTSMRNYMKLFPYKWWYDDSSNWLLNQLSSSAGRRWLAANRLPWPALIARLDGEVCGPPGFVKRFTRNIPTSGEIIFIPVMTDCEAKDSLMDLYDMVSSLEESTDVVPGRTHPMVGYLLREFKEWPDFSANIFAEGDKEIASLLFGISFYKNLV